MIQRIVNSIATVAPKARGGELLSTPVGKVVMVKRFGEAIFSTLRPVESVFRGGIVQDMAVPNVNS